MKQNIYSTVLDLAAWAEISGTTGKLDHAYLAAAARTPASFPGLRQQKRARQRIHGQFGAGTALDCRLQDAFDLAKESSTDAVIELVETLVFGWMRA